MHVTINDRPQVLMWAIPTLLSEEVLIPGPAQVEFLSRESFEGSDPAVRQRYEEVLWGSFHTRDKYRRIYEKTDHVALALDDHGQYLGSALVIDKLDQWLVDYVVTDPNKRRQGIAHSMLVRILKQARYNGVYFVTLHCDPRANNGRLPSLYRRVGFEICR